MIDWTGEGKMIRRGGGRDWEGTHTGRVGGTSMMT